MSFKNKLKVLVVDNDEEYRDSGTAKLRALGVETQEAENGKEAVEFFANGSNFDLVLMELEMPIMDGYQATWEILSMKNGPMVLIKIVAVTANPTSWGENDFLKYGGDEYYPKPMKDVDLIALLEQADNNK